MQTRPKIAIISDGNRKHALIDNRVFAELFRDSRLFEHPVESYVDNVTGVVLAYQPHDIIITDDGHEALRNLYLSYLKPLKH